jgi:hypothetical protein
MDKRKFNGGSRKNAGRKKGSGFSSLIKKYVDDFMYELLDNAKVKDKILQDLKQLSLTSGYIYIIKDLDTLEIKIGVTQVSNPKRRLSQYSSHKINYELLFIDTIEDCYEIENEIHLIIENKRVKGDWFNINDAVLLDIIKLINKRKYQKLHNG